MKMWLFLHVNHNGSSWEIVRFLVLLFVPQSSLLPWLLQCAVTTIIDKYTFIQGGILAGILGSWDPGSQEIILAGTHFPFTLDLLSNFPVHKNKFLLIRIISCVLKKYGLSFFVITIIF